MTIPIPFPVSPGDRLTVVQDKPCGTDLMTGDLVTVLDVGIHVASGIPAPVVKVSTAYGNLLLTFNVVQPAPAQDLPTVTAAEPDELVDEFFFRILGNDDDLRDWAVRAREELAANDPKGTAAEPNGGGTAVAERPRPRQVGESYVYKDPADDVELEVTYVEQTCPKHGREGGFYFTINENDDEAVFISAEAVEPLIKYLFTRRNHSRRPDDQE